MTIDIETLGVVQEHEAGTSGEGNAQAGGPSLPAKSSVCEDGRTGVPDGKRPCGFDLDKITRPTTVIHPALDWVNGQLVVGVVFEDGHRAALTSRGGLVEIDQIGRVCERDGHFDSPVTPEMAKEFLAYLETNPTTCPKTELNTLLIELTEYFRRFVVFPGKHWASVMATWVLGTYLFPMFQNYPYVWLTSRQPGCGKSLLGQILANLSFNGEFMSSPTEANMFHLPEQNRGVQVWDEVEFGNQVERSKFQSVKAILLVGYRNGGVVPRQVGKSWDKQVKYHVFCPRVLIGLSQLPETARQRSIELRLCKRTADQEAEIYRVHDHAEEEAHLRAKCVLIALKSAEGVNRSYRETTLRKDIEALSGKVGREVDDIWLPLFAVADPGSANTSSLAGDLAKAARELTRFRETEMAADSPHSLASYRKAETEAQNKALVAALAVLSCGPTEPADLADRVSNGLDSEVSAQLLSKNLGRLGIVAKKQNGRRVFNVSARELETAKAKLGIEPSGVQDIESGQEGQDGQRQSTEAEHVLVETT
jgi:hypothetical protein